MQIAATLSDGSPMNQVQIVSARSIDTSDKTGPITKNIGAVLKCLVARTLKSESRNICASQNYKYHLEVSYHQIIFLAI